MLLIIIIASAFPAGYLLAYLCKDELKAGRKWFRLIAILSVILLFFFVVFMNKIEITGTLAYLCVVSLISFYKSNDRKFTKK